MTKRLRGWQFEQELGLPDHLEKGNNSALATALLTLWCHGKLPGTTIRWLAECATLDGAEHHELAAIAKCGSHGVHPGNVHRDLMAHFCKGIDLPSGFPISVPCKHPKTLKKVEETAQVFLPHIMFSKLATYSSFDKLFPLDCLENFWAQAEKTGDDRLINHPLKKGKSWKKFCIPIFLHGDGVEFQSRDTIMVYSWGSLLSQKNSLCSHMYIAGFPKSCTLDETWVTMWEWISWSFAAMQTGYHPTHDPKMKPLKKDSPFFLEKGQPLAKGYRGVLWSIQGDHEFFCKCFEAPPLGSKETMLGMQCIKGCSASQPVVQNP